MNDGRGFTVTAEWLDTHCTARNGYKRGQIALLGIEWPPCPAWKVAAVGRRITHDSRVLFEALAAGGQRAEIAA